MTMNPLPPQAYTKETLLKAYSWLQNQPSNIKEMASTPDVLVSLYLKTTRDGEGALSRPSIQNFKHELKQLAHMMGELEAPATHPPHSAPASHAHGAGATFHNSGQAQNISRPEAPPPIFQRPSLPEMEISAYPTQLDPKSWYLIQEVKERLNLSSETEALRLLIKVGSDKIKSLS